MKKHLALLDSDGDIHDTLEINDGEFITPAPAGFEWVELKQVQKDFHKDPEKYNIKKDTQEKLEEVPSKKPEIILNVSSTKVVAGDKIDIFIDIPGENKSSILVINDQKTPVDDGDRLSIQLVDAGVYKISCEDKRFYCPIVHIDVLEKV